MDINWTEIIIAFCSLVITGVIVPFINSKIKNEKAKLSQQTQETIDYWVTVGVKWAKQWLQSYDGEAKKDRVLSFLSDKMNELGIKVTLDDLDKIIEAIYEEVKDCVERPPTDEEIANE